MSAQEPGRVEVGDYATWVRQLRGGYGYTEHVGCRVVGRGPKRLKIRATKATGEVVERWVEESSLIRRGGREVSDGE